MEVAAIGLGSAGMVDDLWIRTVCAALLVSTRLHTRQSALEERKREDVYRSTAQAAPADVRTTSPGIRTAMSVVSFAVGMLASLSQSRCRCHSRSAATREGASTRWMVCDVNPAGQSRR